VDDQETWRTIGFIRGCATVMLTNVLNIVVGEIALNGMKDTVYGNIVSAGLLGSLCERFFAF
jgi:hypothetical protein